MHVRFWGTRGSIAVPGPTTLRYGGNTSCVELRSASGTVVVIDCGTGARGLGQALMKQGEAKRGHMLISHTHWDHINGLPFFAPLFSPNCEWDIYGPAGLTDGLRQSLAGQMEHTYFPVSLDELAARIHYHDLVEGTFKIGDIEVSARYLNHPALTLGYRFSADNETVVYSCDHEPHLPAAASGDVDLTGRDLQHAAFLSGADLVIHDAQYVSGEYKEKTGWGHSTAEYALRACQRAGVRKVVLTHHDPTRTDEDIDRLLAQMRERVQGSEPPLEVSAAAEGEVIELSPNAKPAPTVGTFPAESQLQPQSLSRDILMRINDPKIRELLVEAAELEEVPRLRLLDELGPAPLSSENCSLVILEHNPPTIDARDVAKKIRADEPGDAFKIPIVAVSKSEADAQARKVFTDWLVTPFSLSFARTKIRAWMLRVACRWIRARHPADEVERLGALRDLAILDTPEEDRFDRITRVASATFDVPIALVSLVDEDRQWFKSCVGLDVRETSRDVAFCAHAVELRRDVVVPDTLLDDRFADNPLVTGEPRIRFYAGAPLILKNGRCIGTLCIIDRRPRMLTTAELSILHDLRDMALAELEAENEG